MSVEGLTSLAGRSYSQFKMFGLSNTFPAVGEA
jgi:hypothetical protein